MCSDSLSSPILQVCFPKKNERMKESGFVFCLGVSSNLGYRMRIDVHLYVILYLCNSVCVYIHIYMCMLYISISRQTTYIYYVDGEGINEIYVLSRKSCRHS